MSGLDVSALSNFSSFFVFLFRLLLAQVGVCGEAWWLAMEWKVLVSYCRHRFLHYCVLWHTRNFCSFICQSVPICGGIQASILLDADIGAISNRKCSSPVLVYTHYTNLCFSPSLVLLWSGLAGPLADDLNLIGWEIWGLPSTQGIFEGRGPARCYVRYQWYTLRHSGTTIVVCE